MSMFTATLHVKTDQRQSFFVFFVTADKMVLYCL